MKTMKIMGVFVLGLLLMPLSQSPLMGRDGMPKSAETTAKQFLSAYKSCNRAAALKVASPAVVKKVFKNCRQGEVNWEYMGCDKEGKGYSCNYYYEGGAANLRVVKYGSGYRAVSVGFVAD